jgi:hypothetical protein
MPIPANTSTPFPRHLAGLNAPPRFPSAYASTITDYQAWLHMGAAPDASGGSSDAAFEVRRFSASQQWMTLVNTHDPIYPLSLTVPSQRCLANGQYCFSIRAQSTAIPALTEPRYVYFHQGLAGYAPHIAAFFSRDESTVVLEYAFPGAIRYRVYEYHGGETFVSNDSVATQITVNRILGALNAYTVTAELEGGAGWTQSAWLYLYDETVPIQDYLPLVLKPPPSPTPTRTRTPTPCPFAPDDPRCTG